MLVLSALPGKEKSDEQVTVTRHQIPTADGSTISALLYTPIRADRPLPCLIDFHGGGFVFKAAPHHFALARAYATQTPCAVLFPDYRLLPEHRFPAPVEDAYSSLLWLDSGERFRCRPVSGLFRGVGHGDSRRGPVADALGMGDGAWTAYLIK